MNIYFGKISKKFDLKQIAEGYYSAPKGSTWFGDIDIEDYVFIIGGDKIQLWKAKEWGEKNNKPCLWFSIINNNLEIDLNKFTSLNFFKLTTDLIVLTSRSTRNRAFFKLDVIRDLSLEYISDSKTYKNKDIYRKILIHENKENLLLKSIDIQLYYDNNQLKLYGSSFIDSKIVKKFSDNLKYDGKGLIKKDNVIKLLKSKEFKPTATFNNRELSMRSLYDTLFCEYKIKEIDEKTITIKSLKNKPHSSLNQILYGPPGTGKTYNTILEAAKIVKNNEDLTYEEAKKIFNENLGNQIQFITFHQNYCYEDFIQGLRPDVRDDNDQLKFRKCDGVFKVISDRAYTNLKESKKDIVEMNQAKAFSIAMESLKDKILESDEPVKINETAYFTAVEDDAFRYSGDNWTLNDKGFNGFRMKYSDLERFFEEKIQERKEIKNLSDISGLAKQHATYFIKAYNLVKSLIPEMPIKAHKIKRKNYVIIIDEINRANISRVFGELITLIEPDKRSHGDLPLTCTLPSGDKFIVPSNLYIIGTMNTADKSIALLDIALRRRFDFVAMYPRYNIDGEDLQHKTTLKKLNDQIIKSKGHDFQIGHSYFMGDTSLKDIMNKKVIPLLLEYYMNDEKEVKGILINAGLTIDKENIWPVQITG